MSQCTNTPLQQGLTLNLEVSKNKAVLKMNWFLRNVFRQQLRIKAFMAVLGGHAQKWGKKPTILESCERETTLNFKWELTAHFFPKVGVEKFPPQETLYLKHPLAFMSSRL